MFFLSLVFWAFLLRPFFWSLVFWTFLLRPLSLLRSHCTAAKCTSCFYCIILQRNTRRVWTETLTSFLRQWNCFQWGEKLLASFLIILDSFTAWCKKIVKQCSGFGSGAVSSPDLYCTFPLFLLEKRHFWRVQWPNFFFGYGEFQITAI